MKTLVMVAECAPSSQMLARCGSEVADECARSQTLSPGPDIEIRDTGEFAMADFLSSSSDLVCMPYATTAAAEAAPTASVDQNRMREVCPGCSASPPLCSPICAPPPFDS